MKFELHDRCARLLCSGYRYVFRGNARAHFLVSVFVLQRVRMGKNRSFFHQEHAGVGGWLRPTKISASFFSRSRGSPSLDIVWFMRAGSISFRAVSLK